MLFRYYFFKEGSREYDHTKLIKYFQSSPYFTKNTTSYYSYIYTNLELDFKAIFHLSPKAKLKGNDKISSNYLDTNVYVEFDNLLPSYDCELILDICEDICKNNNFKIYNEYLKDVIIFKKSVLLSVYNIQKTIFKQTYPEQVAKLYKCESKELDKIYEYTSQKGLLNDVLADNNIYVPAIKFFASKGKRTVYSSIDVRLNTPFVLPAFVDMIRIVDEKMKSFISLDEFLDKAKKQFHLIDSQITNLYYCTSKDMKKIIKIINKSSFSPLILELEEVDFKNVIDI